MKIKNLIPKSNFRSSLARRYHTYKTFHEWNGNHFQYLLPNHLWVDTLDFVITTKCSLRCKGCANYISQYENPYDTRLSILLETMKKLDECADRIEIFSILGGEPFLYPNLKEVLLALPREKCRIVYIITNGTIVPKDQALLDVIKAKNITVLFSNYECSQKTQQKFIKILEKNDISYVIRVQEAWYDFGDGNTNYQRSEQELRQQFFDCRFLCNSILNGVVYFCPRASHGYDLGKFGCNKGESVDLIHNTRKQNIKQWRKLIWRTRPVEACKYCKRGTKDYQKIERSTQ